MRAPRRLIDALVIGRPAFYTHRVFWARGKLLLHECVRTPGGWTLHQMSELLP